MNNHRLLVVDEDADFLDQLSSRIRNIGYSDVMSCRTEAEAIDSARQFRPDAILINISLAEPLSGIRAAKQMVSTSPCAFVFFSDGTTSPPLKAVESMPHSYLGKPFTDQQLCAAIHDALRQRDLLKISSNWQKAYNEVSERHGFMEAVLSNIQSGIVVVDPDYRIRLLNPYAERAFQVNAQAVYGQSLETLCSPFADAVRNNGLPDEVRCDCCKREHVVGFKLFAITNDEGQAMGQIISFLDLTEIIKVRRLMKEKERLATLGEFVAKVAHEIRNPLFGMTAICQILSQELKLSGEHKTLLDTMLSEAWRLKRLVEELLDCSRELNLKCRPTDFSSLLRDVYQSQKVLSDQHAITLDASLPDEEVPVMIDGDRIRQVVINLLKNGAEACSKGGTVSLSLARNGNFAVCSVSDNGSGIGQQHLERVFDVFYTTKRQGTGLGLAISKNIIEGHGGTISAANRDEGGALFSFTVPLNSPPANYDSCQ